MKFVCISAEPNNYDIYFELNITDGTVSKIKKMNTSNPQQYVLFVEVSKHLGKGQTLRIELFASFVFIHSYL